MSLATGLTSSTTSGKDVLGEAADVREVQNASKEVGEVSPGGKHGPGGYHKSSSISSTPSPRGQEAHLIK